MASGPFASARRIRRRFFARPAEVLAENLLGCALVLQGCDALLALRLVEVEAYLGVGQDPASHAYRGKTARNAEMFATPGHLYVYFTYGMHYCMNVVAERKGVAGAVLLRAGEVICGEEPMRARRGRGGQELLNGPAKMCQALGIDSGHNGWDLTQGRLGLWPFRPPRRIGRSPRVGIRQGRDLLLRFFDPDSQALTRKAE
jgi:DNA-3-methyladenine glycosylase